LNIGSDIVTGKGQRGLNLIQRKEERGGPSACPNTMKPVYRVYEARNLGESDVYRVAVSDLRELSFREEIARGERLMQLIRLVDQTGDRNEARNMADLEV